jgi:hypothetical protein
MFLWLEASLPIGKKLHDSAGTFNTSKRSCALPGARTFFTVAFAFVDLAKSELRKISFDSLVA